MTTLSLNRPLPRGEDLPFEDDIALESEWHRLTLTVLIDILCQHWQDRDDIYVGGNMFIYFDPEQATTRHFRGPDVFVVKGVASRHMRRSWVVWEEGGLMPNVVIELTSPSNAADDFGVKKNAYEHELSVPEYFIYNPETQRLHGWRLQAGRYGDELSADERGWLWSEQLGLWIGAGRYHGPQAQIPVRIPRFYNAQGQMLPSKAEAQAQRAEAEAQRAEVEAQRAEAEAQRAEAEAQRAEAQAQRADQAEQWAAAETQRADQEAAQRRQLEAELARLRAERDAAG